MSDEEVHININDDVRFKWRGDGKRQHEISQRGEAAKLGIPWSKFPQPPEPDEDGFVTMQLHRFMKEVWPLAQVGYPPPIEHNELRWKRPAWRKVDVTIVTTGSYWIKGRGLCVTVDEPSTRFHLGQSVSISAGDEDVEVMVRAIEWVGGGKDACGLILSRVPASVQAVSAIRVREAR